MREPLLPYKGPNVLNYLCIIATELLGENSLRSFPALLAGFDSLLATLHPNVARAIRNVRLAGNAPGTTRELRLMVDTYNLHHRKLEDNRHKQAPKRRGLYGDEERFGDKGSQATPDLDELDVVSARYQISEDLRIQRMWSDITPDDVAQAILSLTGRLGPRTSPQALAHDPTQSATATAEKQGYEGAISAIDFLPPPRVGYDTQRTARSPGLVQWSDLIAVADRFDQEDTKAGRQRPDERSWYRRLHDETGKPTAVLTEASDIGLKAANGINLMGVKHLIGLPGAGKTTLLFLLAAYMADRGYRACFLFPSIEVSSAFVERLHQYGVSAGLLFGQGETARTKHVSNFAASLAGTSGGYGTTRTIAPYFATNCALAGYALDDDDAFPHSTPPCDSLKQKGEGKQRTRSRRCSLASVCGRQHGDRELANASIWAGHVLSMDRSVSPLFCDLRVRHFEYVARTFDLLVVDECDGAQTALDSRGTPVMKLAGDVDSVWSHLIHDLHGPAARGRNAFVAGLTIPTILEMTARFGVATERLTARIMHFSMQFKKQHENLLLTSLSIISDMYRGGDDSDADEDQSSQLDARQALERVWDVAAKTVAFRRKSLVRAGDHDDYEEDSSIDETDLAKTFDEAAKLTGSSDEVIRGFYERLVLSLETWDRDGSESSMKLVAQTLRAAPALKTAHDTQTFYEYSALLTTVSLLVLQHFGLAPHLRLLNSQGLVGDDVFESRPSRDMLALLPEALVGRLSGVRYSLGDEGDIDIAHVSFAGTPRLLPERMASLGREDGDGPAVLLTSATSLLEDSPSFHVASGPHYVLQRPNAGVGWTNSKYRFMPMRDPSDERRFLKFSGSKLSSREHVLKSIVDQLLKNGRLGEVETAIRENDVVEGHGRKAGFVVNSYDQCELIYSHIYANYPAWRGRVRYLVRANVQGALPENGLTASEIEQLGNDTNWDLLVFPMSAIGRGVNIVYRFGKRADKAMLGSLFFLTRPHPRADSLQLIQGIIGRCSAEFDRQQFASRADAMSALKLARAEASSVIGQLLRLPLAAQALGQYARPFVADQMIMILQTIGRAMRGDCPAFVYFVDSAWASRSSVGQPDTSRTSMLVMMQDILRGCLAHPEPATRQSYEALYKAFAVPMMNVEGLVVHA